MTQRSTAAPAETTGLPDAILEAHDDGRLVVAPLEQLWSEEGIALPATSDATLVLVSTPHRRPKIAGTARALAAEDAHLPRHLQLWEGGSHTFIGDSVILYFAAGDPGQPAGLVPLALANGLELTYGQILALGGDFYGIPDAPISDGKDHAARFRAAYDTLAVLAASVSEAPQILDVMQIEIKAVQKALLDGQSPAVAYEELGNSLNEAWNRITGGGSAVSPWIPEGRYLELADTNWDHFGQHALVAWAAGHEVAMRQAVSASLETDPVRQQAGLATAYSLNAFADHFLSDIFSSGHVRTPRKEIYQLGTPSEITGLLAKYMHDEDSLHGLFVTNSRGDSWIAYGDKRFFDANDAANTDLVTLAVQASVDEVFRAFIDRAMPATGYRQPMAFVPDLLKAQNYQDFSGNFSPLFIPKEGTVYERKSLSDLERHEWTYWWVPTSSLGQLEIIDHKTAAPATTLAPPKTAPAIVRWTSTRPDPPVWVDGRKVRYAVTFWNQVHNALNESRLGPWNAYTTLAGQFQPELEIPVDSSSKATGRRIYRQVEGMYPTLVGIVDDNTTKLFMDTTNIDLEEGA